jgi:hypothetical protein
MATVPMTATTSIGPPISPNQRYSSFGAVRLVQRSASESLR